MVPFQVIFAGGVEQARAELAMQKEGPAAGGGFLVVAFQVFSGGGGERARAELPLKRAPPLRGAPSMLYRVK